jgi:alkanesulfonate monooxygenase
MSLRFHWFLPTNGDGRDIVGGGHGVATGAAGTIRPASLAYLGQIARSAEQLGFEAALTPTGAWCEDAWLATAMLTEVTERLKFLVAFRPGLISPTLSAQMAATFQRYSKGRLLLNVVTGGESAEQQAYGDFASKAERYERCGEFLDIVTRLWAGETVDFDGKHLHVAGARLSRRPDPVPDLYFGGSSAEAGPVAARYTDVYLTWGEPPAAVETKLRWIAGLAAPRRMRFGIRLHVISRDTAEEAWRQADRLIEGVDEAMIAKVQAGLASSESEGLRRMRELHGGSRDGLEVAPNLWAGCRAGPRRCRDRAGRQPRRGRRPDRGVRQTGYLGVHPVRVPAPGGGVLVRRGRTAYPGVARGVESSRAGSRRRHRERDAVRPDLGHGAGRRVVTPGILNQASPGEDRPGTARDRPGRGRVR